ncbi:MAG: hypothetical protein DBX59_04775 [Bacillota bacterium]|nr:MAG: hypothetical protein DBX59_04775 [Bacillota bacterium]
MRDIYNHRYAVTVNGEEKKVLAAPVKNAYFYGGWRYFDIEEMGVCLFSHDFAAPAQIVIRPQFAAKSVRVRPETPYTFENGEVRLSLQKGAKFSVEFDNDIYGNLFVFAEEKRDFAVHGDVVSFPAGVHDAGEIVLKAGQTLYLEEGAYVNGYVKAAGDDIRVCGYGVLCGTDFEHDDEKPREMLFCAKHGKNLLVEGVFLLDSPAWTLCVVGYDGVKIDNVKQVGSARNSDGLDICASSNVVIENCFLRNYDDNISVKAQAGDIWGDCRNIVMKNCVLWGDCAHSMLIGPESNPAEGNVYENIVFENIRVLEHKEYHELYQGVMAIFAADNAVIRNVRWENIEVDNISYGRLFSFTFTEAYATTVGRKIENVLMKNVNLRLPTNGCGVAAGFDAERKISGVVVENMVVANQKVKSESAFIYKNEFAEIKVK